MLPISNEDEDDRSIMTEFTIFDPCPFCGQLNWEGTKPEDCKRCGTGRVVINQIIEDILLRQAIKEAELISRPCRVCGVYH